MAAVITLQKQNQTKPVILLRNVMSCQHHRRQQYCKTRLQYRQGKQLTAVKVYTVANESIHLLVFGVPKINLHQEVKRAFQRYGGLHSSTCVTEAVAKNVELELFTDVYHVKFHKLEHSRRAKRFMDAKEFYGGILHISYAPEYETVSELRSKLQQREREIKYRNRLNAKNVEKILPKTSESSNI